MRALLEWLDGLVCYGIRGGQMIRHPDGGYTLQPPLAFGGGSGAGITYEGDYDSTRSYSKNMVVRKRTGTKRGFYICWTEAPIGTAPTYPEPTTGTVYWHLWAFGPVEYNECSDDPLNPVRQIYVNASDLL